MSLVWQNLRFSTDVPSVEKVLSACCCCSKLAISDKQILKNLNGSINLGELIALMGPSGAGKSTLLNCITQGKKCDGCDGQIKISDLSETVRASFISQDEKEHLLETLTVSQSLFYASKLKNPRNTSKATHDEIVAELIKELELEGTQNTPVRRISGGQRKRLAIALELTALAKPHFLFLNEPSSGLDSFVGYKVVELLSRLAVKHNMAIVATIHQPSFKIFSLFTRAFIISGAGEFIYNGSPLDLRNFLDASGYQSQCQSNNENPADIAIELASAMNRNKNSQLMTNGHENAIDINSEAELQLVVNIHLAEEEINSEENSTICSKMIQTVKLIPINKSNDSNQDFIEVQEEGLCQNRANFNFYSLWILFQRSAHTSIWKQKRFILVRFGLHAVVAIVLALLYNRTMGLDGGCWPQQLNHSSSQQIINSTEHHTDNESKKDSVTSQNVKFQFFSLLFLMFAALMPTVLTFPAEIKLFLNEFRNGWYSASSYYISKTLTEIPLQFLFPFLYTYFLYWYSQQPELYHWYGGLIGFMSSRYSQFLFVTILCSFIAQGLGFLIGIICVRSFNISIILSSSILLFLFLFSGFFVKRSSMTELTEWITFFSFVRFGFESLILILYGHERCTHPSRSIVLVTFKLDESELHLNIWMLVAHFIIIRIVAFVVLINVADPNYFVFSFNKGCLKSAAKAYLACWSKIKPARRKVKSLCIRLLQFCLIFLAIQIIVAVVIGIIAATHVDQGESSNNATTNITSN